MVKKQILVSIMVITLLFNSVAPSAFAMDSHNKEALDLETNENIELSNEQLKTLPVQPTEEGKEQVPDIANEVPVIEGENTVNVLLFVLLQSYKNNNYTFL